MTWLLPLALGFALFPGDVAGRRGEPARVRRFTLGSRRLRVAVVAAALCGYLAATIDTGRDTKIAWERQASDQSKRFALNLQRDADRLERQGASLVTIDDQTPAFLVGPRHRPWNRLERLVPAIAPQLRVVPAAARPLQVHQDGRLTPASVHGLASGPGAIPDAGRVRLTRGRRFFRHGRPCLRTRATAATLAFATDANFAGQSLFGQVTYDVLRAPGDPLVVSGNTYRRRRSALSLAPGPQTAVLNLGKRMQGVLPAGTTVCLRSAGVGWIAP